MYCHGVKTALRPKVAPPSFLQLAGHPLRWQLLTELAYSDRQVRELTATLGEPQNLVSYHLSRLRAGGIVSMRRSSFDGRDAYYRVDLDRCGELLGAAGGALHPGLALTPPTGLAAMLRGRRVRVLFLCTGNSTRSQMAEALLRDLAGDAVEVHSAGSHPKSVHPSAVRVMGERGIDISTSESKALSKFAKQRFDYVVTLCDRVREVCPKFSAAPERIHWSIADPAGVEGTEHERCAAFERTAEDIEGRVRFLLHAIRQKEATRR